MLFPAHVFVQTNRTPLQCFRRYQRSLNTTLLRSKWTEEEDNILTEAVKQYGEKNWQQGIPISSRTHSTSFSCALSRSLSLFLSLSVWPSLTCLQFPIAWKGVLVNSAYIDGKSPSIPTSAVASGPRKRTRYYTRQYLLPLPLILTQMLNTAVIHYGVGNWSKVAQHVPGRTDTKCRERYMNVLNPDVSKPWTDEVRRTFTHTLTLPSLSPLN